MTGPEIRIGHAPLEHGAATLVAALMRRLGQTKVTLDVSELGDGDLVVMGSWDFQGATVTLEVEPGTTDPAVAEFNAGMAEAVRRGLLAEFGDQR